MPTLHLIDTHNTQACPAVLDAIQATMSTSHNHDDTLLVLGSRSFTHEATQAGIERLHHIAAPYGQALLGLHRLRRDAQTRPNAGSVTCWSTGALQAAALVFKRRDIRLMLTHTPTPKQITQLRRLRSKHQSAIHIQADNHVLATRLRDEGLTCQTQPFTASTPSPEPMPDAERAELRRRWGVDGDDDRAILLLSDHADLVSALQAAHVMVLGCSAYVGNRGEHCRVSLITHPGQRHRTRAESWIGRQTSSLLIIQDAEAVRPWRLAGACDAVLAIGRDAGGLGLRRIAGSGAATVSSQSGPAGELNGLGDNLKLAPSDKPKDLACMLHAVLS